MNNYSPFKKERDKYGTNRRTAVIVAAGVVIVLVLSCFIIMAKNDFNFKAAVGGEVETTAGEETPDETLPARSTKYYLLWCAREDTENLDFLWIVKAKFPSAALTVFSPSPDDMVEYKGQLYTVRNLYSIFTLQEFRHALEEYYGIKFSAYIGCFPEGFKQAVNDFGGINVDIKEQIDYKGEFNLLLAKGSTPLKGELLYKYLLYTGLKSDTRATDHCEALAKLLEAVFVPENRSKTDSVFSMVANTMITDITIMTYSENKALFDYLFENGLKSIKTAQTKEELKG